MKDFIFENAFFQMGNNNGDFKLENSESEQV